MEIQSTLKQRVPSFLCFVAALILAGQSVQAQQWTGPDGGGNISNTNSGNVGIGTTTPAQKLDVNGNVRIPSTAVIYLSKNQSYSYLATHALALLNESSGTTAPKSVLLFEANRSGNGLTAGTFAGIFGGKENTTDDDAAGVLTFSTTVAGSYNILNERMRINSTGNVGIGTTSPATLLDTRKDQNDATILRVQNGTAGSGAQAAISLQSDNGTGYFGTRSSQNPYGAIPAGGTYLYSSNAPGLTLMAENAGAGIKFATGGNAERVRIDSTGSVGIGTSTPTSPETYSRLTVQASDTVANYLGIVNSGTGQAGLAWRRTGGTASRWVWYLPSGSTDFSLFYGDGVVANSGNKVTVSENGNLTVTGTINAKYQDVAEWVPASEQLAAGTVVVLDSTKANQVTSSTTAYDTRVAGVISAQPGITLGEKSDSKVLVATTGRVRVKVDASRGPIAIGDLLVTSDVPGVAMKSIPVEFAGRKMHMPGTIIGKALEPLAKGKGEILVLLSLQ